MSKGYTQVHALLGGWNAWVNSGGATEPVAESAPTPAPQPTPTPVVVKQPAAPTAPKKTTTRRTRRTRPRSKRPATGH